MGVAALSSVVLLTTAIPLAVFCLTKVIWRLFLTPLKTIPSSNKWAELSGIWLWYHDLKGSAPNVIKETHDKHGPIVRVGPNEVSINDPEVHNSALYCQGSTFMKAPYFYDPFKTGPSGIFQSTDRQEHTYLRRLVSRPFSRKSILDFEPQITDSILEMTSALDPWVEKKIPVDLSKMLRCLALDFITRFTYGESMHAVQSKDFKEDILDAFDSFATSNFMFMMFPSLRTPSIIFLSLIPSPVFQAIPSMRKRVHRALKVYDNFSQKDKEDSNGFKPLLMSEIETASGQSETLTQDFLIADGLADIFAGTDTTSTALILTIRAILMNKAIYNKLHAELKIAMPTIDTPPDLVKLEELPFLSACVKEGLRFSTPVRSRLPRVCPPSGWTYRGHFVPGGTLISSSPHLMNYNEKVFQSPKSYIAERWLIDDPAALKVLEDCWAPFSKGSRGCIGKNLALAEIYMTIGTVIRRYRLSDVVDLDLKFRETFGVIFDSPVRVVLEVVDK
ncbi:hypothetical protein MMC08_004134 [Hypocenomyce scalaris]|nr:hypothetical protein [Hypocenomyce scalaris]